MKTTGKYSVKPYQCSVCSAEHFTDPIAVWECLEPMPEGYEKPTPWKKVLLGDIATIKEVKKG